MGRRCLVRRSAGRLVGYVGATSNPPVNTVLPAISGTPSIGQTLTVSNGTWTGSPTSYTYQWEADAVNISGATSSTYVLTTSEAFAAITCTVTATNADGSTPATSAATAGVSSIGYFGADFDGSTMYLTRGADLTGDADGSKGTLSFWFRLDGGDGTDMVFLTNVDTVQDKGILVRRDSSGSILVLLRPSAGSATGFYTNTTVSFVASMKWYHFLASWDMNFSDGNKQFQIYIDDIAVTGTPTDGLSAFDIDYTRTEWALAARSDANSPFNGCFSEVFFDNSNRLDLSVASNRRKFIDIYGRPAALGSNGSTPFSAQPIVYFPRSA